MAGRRGEAWNDEDLATLRQLTLDGADVVAILRALGRTREAVQTKARRLGLSIVADRAIRGE
jgi:hypothetical protein